MKNLVKFFSMNRSEKNKIISIGVIFLPLSPLIYSVFIYYFVGYFEGIETHVAIALILMMLLFIVELIFLLYLCFYRVFKKEINHKYQSIRMIRHINKNKLIPTIVLIVSFLAIVAFSFHLYELCQGFISIGWL